MWLVIVVDLNLEFGPQADDMRFAQINSVMDKHAEKREVYLYSGHSRPT